MAKTLVQLKTELNEVQGEGKYVYGSDSKQVPSVDSEGHTVYRKVRARRIQVGDAAPTSVGISAPDVGEKTTDDTQNTENNYKKQLDKLYKKYNSSGQVTSPKPLNKEEVSLSEQTSEPPFVLVLKRVNVRQFPNFKVAVYYSDKLNKYFTVPYETKIGSNIQAEETISEQSTFSNFLNVFVNLSEEHQKVMLEMVNGDFESYLKIKKFVSENLDELN